jgi:ribosomal protein S6--L-glutamate ligase
MKGGCMEPSAARPPQIAFLLGKPVKGGSLFPELFELLRGAGLDVAVHLPHTSPDPVPSWLLAAALVVHRGLNLAALKAAQRLEDAEVRCCNRIQPTLALRDRALVFRSLASAGLPVPATIEVAAWNDLRAAAADRAVVIKTVEGSLGRGAGVLIAERDGLPHDAPFAGPYLVQSRVPADGWDRKLYVVGDHVSGLLKPWPRRTPDAKPFSPDPILVGIARRVAVTLNLDVCGVDIVVGADGPVVVDVNPFPGLKGVPNAACILARYLSCAVRAYAAGSFRN